MTDQPAPLPGDVPEGDTRADDLHDRIPDPPSGPLADWEREVIDRDYRRRMLRDRIAEALVEHALTEHGRLRRPAFVEPHTERIVRENSASRADAVVAVVRPVLDERDREIARLQRAAGDLGEIVAHHGELIKRAYQHGANDPIEALHILGNFLADLVGEDEGGLSLDEHRRVFKALEERRHKRDELQAALTAAQHRAAHAEIRWDTFRNRAEQAEERLSIAVQTANTAEHNLRRIREATAADKNDLREALGLPPEQLWGELIDAARTTRQRAERAEAANARASERLDELIDGRPGDAHGAIGGFGATHATLIELRDMLRTALNAEEATDA